MAIFESKVLRVLKPKVYQVVTAVVKQAETQTSTYRVVTLAYPVGIFQAATNKNSH